MIAGRMFGYLYVMFGSLLILYFAGQLLVQLIAILVGISFIVQGLKILSVDRMVYRYSQMYFNNKFRK